MKFIHIAILLLLSFPVAAQVTVIQASQMLDVRSGKLISPAIIVVEDGLIKAINPEEIPSEAHIIDLKDKVLLPGLIDTHVHLQLEEGYPPSSFLMESVAHATLRTVKNAEKNLLAGFTTLRTVGQDHPTIELLDVEVMRAEEQGLIHAPRIIPSGHAISITGGHFDLSMFDDFAHGVMEFGWKHGIADNVDEVVKAVRYQIKHGAKVIKVTATTGIMSQGVSAGAQQYSEEELTAIVKEAAKHGVRVAAHAHGTEGIIAAIRAGVASIEHGSILTEEAIKLMVEKSTYLVATAHVMVPQSLDHMSPSQRKKQLEVQPFYVASLQAAYKAGVKIAFGTDVGIPDEINHGENAKEFDALVRLGLSNIDAIRAATIHAASLLGVSDRGVIEVGKLADIIAVDVDPSIDISTMHTVSFVMKGGVVYKAE